MISKKKLDTVYDVIYNRYGVYEMSKFDKLLQKIKSLSKDLRFDELRKVLESCGYVMSVPSGGGSHYTFRKPGKLPITIPKHEPIKKIYVLMVKDVVEREGSDDENA